MVAIGPAAVTLPPCCGPALRSCVGPSDGGAAVERLDDTSVPDAWIATVSPKSWAWCDPGARSNHGGGAETLPGAVSLSA